VGQFPQRGHVALAILDGPLGARYKEARAAGA
jgi:hypothetical protein